MKRTHLMIALLVPAAAIASQDAGQPDMDHEQLRNHLHATSILGAQVQYAEGRTAGVVEDIVFDMQGNISSVLVTNGEHGGSDDNSNRESRERDSDIARVRADGRARTDREGNVIEDNAMQLSVDAQSTETAAERDAGVHLQWSNVNFDAEENVLRVDNGTQFASQPVQYDQMQQAAQGGIPASSIVGLEVNLLNEESFGEVEDILIDAENGKASAVIVDTMEFFDKERYALPASLQGYDASRETLTLQLTQEQVEAMGEF